MERNLSKEESAKAARDSAFGLWKETEIDGLEYQLTLRAEFDRDDSFEYKAVGEETE